MDQENSSPPHTVIQCSTAGVVSCHSSEGILELKHVWNTLFLTGHAFAAQAVCSAIKLHNIYTLHPHVYFILCNLVTHCYVLQLALFFWGGGGGV